MGGDPVHDDGIHERDAQALRVAGRPAAGRLTRPYWTLGSTGSLHMMKCDACSYINHPPKPVCRRCASRHLTWSALSGRGKVYGYGINAIDWNRDFPRFAVAIVDLDDQPALRVFTRLVGCDPDTVTVGLPVEVRFERLDDELGEPLFLPVFTPVRVAP